MGLFKKNTPTGTSHEQPKEPQYLPVYTIGNLPGRNWEPVCLVTATSTKLGVNTSPVQMAKLLYQSARKVGADAVLGFRIHTNPSALNTISLSGFGTAIRFLDKDENGSRPEFDFDDVDEEDLQ